MKLSRAAEAMLNRIAMFEAANDCLQVRGIDHRVYPRLTRAGLVASNIYHGVCFTPKGRSFWKARRANPKQ